MPYVKFLKDYRGPLTNDVPYLTGDVVDLPGRASYALRTLLVVERTDTPAPAKLGAGKAKGKAAPKGRKKA